MLKNESADRHLSLTAAAAYLGKSTRWLQYQVAGSNPPPGFRIGKNWFFKKSELDNWLRCYRVGDDILAELGGADG